MSEYNAFMQFSFRRNIIHMQFAHINFLDDFHGANDFMETLKDHEYNFRRKIYVS